MNIRGFYGVLYIAADWMFRLASVNLLWILCNFPVVFFALGLLIVETTEELIPLGIMIVLLLPFFFFPASTAMVNIIKQWVIDEKDINVLKPFFQSYRKYYLKSFFGGIFITIFWLIFVIDYIYFFDRLIVMNYVLYFLLIMLIVYTIYFFSSVQYYSEESIGKILNENLRQTIRKPLVSFIVAVLSLLAIYISFNLLTFLIPLLMGSFIALISCLSYRFTRDEVKKVNE